MEHQPREAVVAVLPLQQVVVEVEHVPLEVAHQMYDLVHIGWLQTMGYLPCFHQLVVHMGSLGLD